MISAQKLEGAGGQKPASPTEIIAASISVSPYISVYPWSAGFGTKYADPSTLPTGVGRSVAFNTLGTAIAVTHSTSPYISVYPWSAGFGTKYADPSTLPTGNFIGVTFAG